MTSSGRIFRGARVVALCTLGSRVLGLIRDVLLAHLITGMARDAFLFAWTLPNLFRRLFGEGALSAAFIPTYSGLLEQDKRERAGKLAMRAATLLVIALLLGIGLLELAACAPAGWWQRLFPDDAPAKVELILSLTRVMAPYALLVCLVAFMAGMHNARRSFAVPAAMPIVLNLVWIAALLAGAAVAGASSTGGLEALAESGVMLLGWAILGAGALQLVIVWWPERRNFSRVEFPPDLKDEDLKEVMSRFLPMTIGLGIYQLNLLLDRFIAESFIAGDGAVTALYFGDRLMQLPQALVGIAVATAAFPEFSRLAATGDRKALAASVVSSLRLCSMVAVPAAIGLAIVAGPTVDLFFRGEAFGPELAERTTWVVAIVALAVVAASLLHVLVRAHYSLGEVKAPVWIGAVAVAVNLTLNLSLVWTFEEKGLAIATVVSTAVNAGLLYFSLRRLLPELKEARTAGFVVRVLVSGIAMGLLVWFCRDHVVPEGDGLLVRIGRLVLPVLVGMGGYVLLASLLGVEELRAWIALRGNQKGS